MLTEGDRAEKLDVELIVEERANLQMHWYLYSVA